MHRLSAVILCVGFIAGNATVCAGWLPSPDARMACCADGGDCPMHKGESDQPASARVLTQAEADNCCAASEPEQSSPSAPTVANAISIAVLGPATVVPMTVPALVLSDDWRTASPIPTTPVPKHVLLSVYLV